jgi:O-antigen/teichoic acid export membrane protein
MINALTQKIDSPASAKISSGQERSIKVKKNIFISLIVKGGSLATGFILVPITINYINPTTYGIWITLSSVIGWFSFFDIGFGNGLRNKFAESVANNNHLLARKYVSTTYAILALIIAATLGLFFVVHRFVDWAKVLNAPAIMSEDLNKTALIVFSFFCMTFVLSLLNTVLKANQEPSKASILELLGNILALGGIFVLTKTTSGSLIYLALTLSLAPVIILILGSIYIYKGKYKQYAPSFSHVDFNLTKDLTSLGLKFFIMQLSAVIVYNTQNMIISHLFGPEEVTTYTISYKVFNIPIMLFTIVSLPLWSAFTEAYIKKDFTWIKDVLKKMNQFWYLSILLTVVIYFTFPFIVKVWIGDQIQVPVLLSLILVIYVLSHIWMSIYITFLNGSGKIKLQFYCSIFSTLLNIPLSIFLGKTLGISGIPLAGAILFSSLGILFYIQQKKLIDQTATGLWNK